MRHSCAGPHEDSASWAIAVAAGQLAALPLCNAARLRAAACAGVDDRIADARHNSARLHEDIAHNTLTMMPGAGHMIQHLSQHALALAVKRVLEHVTARAGSGCQNVLMAFRYQPRLR